MARRDIMVIGASAGGVSTLQTVLSGLPWDLPVSVFIVLHTSEDGPGLLPEVLNRSSKMPVLYGVHDMQVLPGRVYVARPGAHHMILERGQIRSLPGPRENRHRPSIDAFFRSASQAYGSRLIGVVLTGHLDDGALGLAEIKKRGGLAVVQDPDDAFAPSMPLSAIENAEVDFTLPAAEIGPKLAELATAEVEEGPKMIRQSRQRLEATGQPYSCPECDGVLQEMREGEMVRFRCRVGHVYSPESLHADMNVAVEKALWAAIRTLEEHAEFSDRLASRSERNSHARLASRFSKKASASREGARVLRELLEHSAEQVMEMPVEQETGT